MTTHGGRRARCPRGAGKRGGEGMQGEQAPGRGLRFRQWPPEGAAHSPSTLIFTLGPMVNWGRVGTGFSPEGDAAGRGAGGERGGDSQGQNSLPLLRLGSESPRQCPPPSSPGSQGSPKAGEPRTGRRPGAGSTHWRRSRRTPSSSDTSSAGCGWAWLGRTRGLSGGIPRAARASLKLLSASRPSRAVSFSSCRAPGHWLWGSAISPFGPTPQETLSPEVPPPECPAQKTVTLRPELRTVTKPLIVSRPCLSCNPEVPGPHAV